MLAPERTGLALAGLLAASAFVATFVARTTAPARQLAAIAERGGVRVVLDQPYAANSNPRQRVDLYLPIRRSSEKPLPVVVFIHGGGWMAGDRKDYALAAISLAGSGDYAAVSSGYRLTDEAHWPEQAYDVKAAIRWVRGHAREYGLDVDRIGVSGSSAGGHLASFLGTSGDVAPLEGTLGEFPSLSSRVQAVVSLCAPEDLTRPLMSDDKGTPVVNDDAVTGLLGGTVVENPDLAVAASPLTYVSSDDPPFLVVHGDADERVAYSNATAIHAALRKAGVASVLVPIPGGAHASVMNADVTALTKEFFDQHLRGMASGAALSPSADLVH